jgi:RimJ/RimL family protein N-acetyltransferase
MNTVYVRLKDTEEQLDTLKKRLESEGWKIEDQKEPEEMFLLLSDRKEWIQKAAACGIPTVYYERPGSDTAYEADLVILDLSVLDGLTLERTWQRHEGIPWKIAETEEWLIRESREEDFEALYGIYQESEVTTYIPSLSKDREKEKEKFLSYIRHQYPFYGYGLYSLIEKKSEQVIGRIGFENREYEGRIYLELGYLISTSFRGRGLAFRASLELLQSLEELTGEEKVTVFYHPQNIPSRRTAEKLRMACPEKIQLIPLFFP